MAAKDAAFMWETEALRSSVVSVPPRSSADPGDGWLTLRETTHTTGIPISTLRKWVRKDSVPSFIDETADGPIRMLWLEGVRERAEKLGRELEAVPDGFEEESGAVDVGIDPATEPAPAPADEPAPGTMVVPIEAWDKMLIQLGNLHEAGQQLAEARERAAKAETEARFLKERVAELRAEKAAAVPTPAPEPAPRRRVSIEVEDGSEEPMTQGSQPVVEEGMVEDESFREGTSLSSYSLAVFKHLYGTWRDRPRRSSEVRRPGGK